MNCNFSLKYFYVNKCYFYDIGQWLELMIGVGYILDTPCSHREKETNKCRNFMVSFVSIIKHNTE